MLTYRIDEDGKIIEHPLIASLYFDIKYGPLQNKLIYEYGGKTLSAYRYGVKEYSLENNKRILIDLFTIFAELVHKDNMHNDIKCANTVYSIEEPSLVVKTKLIDFGSSRSISQMETGKDSFVLRTNMNSPEAILNYLHLNKWPGFEVSFTKNFKRWYYYPFISILYYLYTGNEYSTGDKSYMHQLYGSTSSSKQKYKFNCLEHLKNNENIKQDLAKHIHIKDSALLTKLNNIIDMMCVLNPDERASEEAVLGALNKL